MRPNRIDSLFLTGFLTLMLAACSDDNDDSVMNPAPPAPDEPVITVAIDGAVTKGVIEGASVSVVGADGETIAGAGTSTDAAGRFSIEFTQSEAPSAPLLLQVDAANATAVCDLQPVCNVGVDEQGDPVAVGFGETYELPDDFVLRAPIESFESDGDDRRASVHASPLSEFVVAAALEMGGGTLTASHLDVANARLADVLGGLFPSLALPATLRVGEVPLIDATRVETIVTGELDETSIAMTAMVAAIHDFVAPGSSARGNIAAVVAEFAGSFSAADTAASVFSPTDIARLGRTTVDMVTAVTDALQSAVDRGDVSLPDAVSLDGVRAIRDEAREALPELVDIWTLIERVQQTAPIESANAIGFADLILLPATGEVDVTFEVSGLDATAAHLHRGFAGQNGPVLLGLEQDPDNPGRWHFPDDATLDADAVEAVLAGETYFNVHTEAHPAGEIRGQVVPPGIEMVLATPRGTEQVPSPVSSDGFARAAVTLNTETALAQVHFTSSNISLVAAHIHEGVAGTNGPVVVGLDQDMQDMNHWSASDVDFSELAMPLREAGLYFNLHTRAHPAGELRGQIVPAGYQLRISFLDAGSVVGDIGVDSAASGMVATTLNADTLLAEIHLNTQDVVDPLSAHVHTGDPGEAGDVIVDLERDELDPDHWLATTTLTANQRMGLIDGALYVDVHTAAWPDGEIRGQLDDDRVEMDSDGDGVADRLDAFPNDPAEVADADGDGVGNNGDAFPEDPAEVADTDGDGVGDNADNCPMTSNADQADTDGDGAGDACDTEEPAPAFAEVQNIFDSRCVICHGVSGGLSLESPASFDNLVNTPSTQISSLDRVEPGDPENSYLVWKIEGRSGIVGGRMPLGATPLSQSDIDLIRSWIEAGADP